MSQSIVEIRYFHTPGVEGLRTIGSVLLSLVLWGAGYLICLVKWISKKTTGNICFQLGHNCGCSLDIPCDSKRMLSSSQGKERCCLSSWGIHTPAVLAHGQHRGQGVHYAHLFADPISFKWPMGFPQEFSLEGSRWRVFSIFWSCRYMICMASNNPWGDTK